MDQLNLFGDSESTSIDSKVTNGLNMIKNGEYYFYPSFFSKVIRI